MNTKITLTEGEVAQAIAENFTRKGIRVKKVNLNVTIRRKDRPGESDVAIFQNAEVEIDPENPLSQLEAAGH
ncbi:hypothetical protein KAR91_11405 [Candidatus Pacearchaeota archaeon]|nr:hypothetical protein [Candidatus Pacearchaeota archaeon]